MVIGTNEVDLGPLGPGFSPGMGNRTIRESPEHGIAFDCAGVTIQDNRKMDNVRLSFLSIAFLVFIQTKLTNTLVLNRIYHTK